MHPYNLYSSYNVIKYTAMIKLFILSAHGAPRRKFESINSEENTTDWLTSMQGKLKLGEDNDIFSKPASSHKIESAEDVFASLEVNTTAEPVRTQSQLDMQQYLEQVVSDYNRDNEMPAPTKHADGNNPYGIASEKLIFSSGPHDATKPKPVKKDSVKDIKGGKHEEQKVIKPIPAMLNKSDVPSPLQRMKKSIHDIVTEITGQHAVEPVQSTPIRVEKTMRKSNVEEKVESKLGLGVGLGVGVPAVAVGTILGVMGGGAHHHKHMHQKTEFAAKKPHTVI